MSGDADGFSGFRWVQTGANEAGEEEEQKKKKRRRRAEGGGEEETDDRPAQGRCANTTRTRNAN